MDWGAFVIVAWLIWPDGHMDTYHPTTRFDEQACFKEAQQLNLTVTLPGGPLPGPAPDKPIAPGKQWARPA